MYVSLLNHPPTLKLAWLTDDIVIGAAPRRTAWWALFGQGVTAVLDLRSEAREDPKLFDNRGVTYKQAPIADGTAPALDQIDALVEWVLACVNGGQRIAIVCRAGLGRSPLIGIATLIGLGFPLEIAYQILARSRPAVTLSGDQMRALQVYDYYRSRQRLS